MQRRAKKGTETTLHISVLVMFLCTLTCANGLTFLSPAIVAGVTPFAPIPEVNLHTVLKAHDGTWGMVGYVEEPPDRTGCSSGGWEGRNLSNIVIFVAGVVGCSSEDKQRVWQARGAMAIIMTSGAQSMADLEALKWDKSDISQLTIPTFYIDYLENWRRKSLRFEAVLEDLVDSHANITVRLDFPDRQVAYWDMRNYWNFATAANYFVFAWSVVLICLCVSKLMVLISNDKGIALSSVPQRALAFCVLGTFFVLFIVTFGPVGSSSFLDYSAYAFFETFYIPFAWSASLLCSFYWLEVTFYNAQKARATLNHLLIPAMILIASVFCVEIGIGIAKALRVPEQYMALAITITYSILGAVVLTVLLFGMVRILTRLKASASTLAHRTHRLAIRMGGIVFSALLMIAGLIFYALIDSERVWRDNLVGVNLMLQSGALLMMSSVYSLFQLKTQKQVLELSELNASAVADNRTGKIDADPELSSIITL